MEEEEEEERRRGERRMDWMEGERMDGEERRGEERPAVGEGAPPPCCAAGAEKICTSSFFIIPQHARLPGGAPGVSFVAAVLDVAAQQQQLQLERKWPKDSF